MNFGFDLSVGEWIAIISLASGLFFSLAKFYHAFTRLNETISELNITIRNLNEKMDIHESRLVALETNNKSIFKRLDRLEEKR